MGCALDQSTLVLNRHWTPIHVTAVRHALTLVFSEKAAIVCPFSYTPHNFIGWIKRGVHNGNPVVGGIGFRIEAPEVIVLQGYAKVPPLRVILNRKNLYRRDNHLCQYCGRKVTSNGLTIDHVIPLSRGGGSSWENCVLACRRCNGHKGSRTPREASMALQQQPVQPSWSPRYASYMRDNRPGSWNSFIPQSVREAVTTR